MAGRISIPQFAEGRRCIIRWNSSPDRISRPGLPVRSISFRRSGRSPSGHRVIGVGAILGRKLPSENAPAAVGMGEPSLLCYQLLYRRTGGVALDESSLVVEAFERSQLFPAAELRALDRRLQHSNCLIVNPKGHRKRMPVLATVRKREARWVGEAI